MKSSTLYILLISFLIIGCSDDYFDNDCQRENDYTYFELSIDEQTEVVTRSEATSNERMINDAYLLIFDGSTNNLKSGEKVDISLSMGGTNGAQKRTIKSQMISSVGDKIVVLINTGMSDLPAQLTKLSDINTYFTSQSKWNLNQTGTNSGKGMPMSGWVVWSSNATNNIIRIKRAVAKVQLTLDPAISVATGVPAFGVNTTTWAMSGYAAQGAIFQPTSACEIPSAALNSFVDAKTTDFTRYPTGSSNANEKQVFYLPEYRSANLGKDKAIDSTSFHKDRVCMIVKNSNKYYRLDFAEKNVEGKYQWMNILRNYHYTVKITKVLSAGYPTLEAALESSATNLEYEIISSGKESNIIVSNGQYAIELEYDRIVAYTQRRSELPIKARIIKPDGVSIPSNNQIACSGVHISNGITKLTTEEQTIRFKINESDQYYAPFKGSLTFTVGNITKVVTIEVKDGFMDAHYDEKKFNVSSTTITWTRLENMYIVKQTPDTLTLRCDENVIPIKWIIPETGAASTKDNPKAEPVFEIKSAEGYVWRTGDNFGKTKIILTQLAPDYAGWAGGEPGQTGETHFSKRLIVEACEELTVNEYEIPNPIPWAPSNTYTGITDLEYGRSNTESLVALGSAYQAAWKCWMRNDKNRDGVVDATEKGDNPWYLPSHYQMLEIWISYPNFNYKFRDKFYYQTSTECISLPDNRYVSRFEFGHMHYGEKNVKYQVRCVKDMPE